MNTTPKNFDCDTSSMRDFVPGDLRLAAQTAAAPKPKMEHVFVPSHAGDRPDSDSSSLRGYVLRPA